MFIDSQPTGKHELGQSRTGMNQMECSVPTGHVCVWTQVWRVQNQTTRALGSHFFLFFNSYKTAYLWFCSFPVRNGWDFVVLGIICNRLGSRIYTINFAVCTVRRGIWVLWADVEEFMFLSNFDCLLGLVLKFEGSNRICEVVQTRPGPVEDQPDQKVRRFHPELLPSYSGCVGTLLEPDPF